MEQSQIQWVYMVEAGVLIKDGINVEDDKLKTVLSNSRNPNSIPERLRRLANGPTADGLPYSSYVIDW